MMKRLAVPLLLTGTLALAACGGEEPADSPSANAPTPAELLTKAITQSSDQKSAAFAADRVGHGRLRRPTGPALPQKPLKAEISGKASPKAVDITGKATVSGRDFPARRPRG